MSSEWYYNEGGKQRGPFNESEIYALMRQGVLYPKSMVWAEGMKKWQPISKIKELQNYPVKPGKTQFVKTKKGHGPDFFDHIIAYLVRAGVLAVIIGVCFLGWRYWQSLDELSGPTEGWLANHYAKTDSEKIIGEINEGEWVTVEVRGRNVSGSYELVFSRLDIEHVEDYISDGKGGIPRDAPVYVWDIHMVIERQSTGDGLFGAAPRQERHVRAYVWNKSREGQGKYWEPFTIKTVPIAANQPAKK